jgi:hypothetical protein
VTTAAAGLVAGLVAGLGAAVWTQRRTDRREDVRWQRERDDRQEQWRREDSLRWLQDRQQAYARLLGVLYDWDAVLSSALATIDADLSSGERTIDTTEIDRRARAARNALAPAQFMAPKAVRSLAQSAVTDREELESSVFGFIAGEVLFNAHQRWMRLSEATSLLQEAMRSDLGLESEAEDTEQQEGGEVPPADGPGMGH